MVYKHQSGYTLIELLVVLAIIGILAFVGIPGYKTFTEKGEFRQAYNNLYNAYRFARSEAIKTSSTMVISPINDAWEEGWVVYAKADSSTLLLNAPALKSDKLSVNAISLSITSRGTVDSTSVTKFTITDTRNGTSKYICILQNGQSYQSEEACLS